jgi:predicted RND superfamily exporter protein
VLLATLLFVAALASQLSNLKADTSVEGFLRADDPALLRFQAFREQFGRDELITIAIRPQEIFDQEFLQNLQQLQQRLEDDVPYVDRVYSLINARDIQAEEDELIVGDLVESLPQSAAEMERLMARTLASPIYRGALISEASDITTVLLRLQSQYRSDDGEWRNLEERQLQAVTLAVDEVLQDFGPALGETHLVGSPVLSADLAASMQSNTLRFTLLTLIMVVALLAYLYRRLSGIVLPLLVIVATIPTTFGVLAILQLPFQTPLVTVPSFLLAVGICAAVHILTIFYLALDRGVSKPDAIAQALQHSGLAVFFTSLTTAAGLSSFLGAELQTVANFGLASAVGVMFSFVFSVTLLPALLALLPVKTRPVMTAEAVPWVRGLTVWCAESAIRHSRTLAASGLVLMLCGGLAATQVHLGNDLKGWFSEDHRIRQSTDFVERHFSGSMQFDMLVDTGEADGIKQGDFLARLAQAQQWLQDYEDTVLATGKAGSVADLLRETNQALMGGAQAHYRLPEGGDMVAQQLFLLELSGTEDLFDAVDEDYQMARVSVSVPLLDAVEYTPFIAAAERRFGELFPEAEVYATGLTPIIARTSETVVNTTAQSYLIAVVLICLMMMLLLGSVKFGLLSMLPNLLPVIMAVGLMGLFGAPLDSYSLPIGAIALGLAVDDTVHFMHNYRRYYADSGSCDYAIRQTLDTAGRALTITTVVMSLAFFVYLFADMVNIREFGLYTGLCIIFAYFSDLLFAPALMKALQRDA